MSFVPLILAFSAVLGFGGAFLVNRQAWSAIWVAAAVSFSALTLWIVWTADGDPIGKGILLLIILMVGAFASIGAVINFLSADRSGPKKWSVSEVWRGGSRLLPWR
ncbi:MAG: DUF1345 domain-containing protein [Hyphomonas sp.]|uniref:hypothetical protein n=1 Tax=Hyphomonas sp. TaxID=87 RepID=UPI0018310DF1|nr:hypothetical protein [Hyphomonas sp.]MBU3921773.1 hypothetical protein [Alphaproteobacteria bacterium]MBA3068635.1 DUF1345 domain-containing protein [Hyphomonas sp.]MBU4061954.1 hypothetical protein [Alphaproteobacteria bacterium]MBU4166109.1 hypothetical protein [Alphaproteobacteria bacterium]MBU4567689.1 hypothetical protein [Alphaproteobacteria bacterium]